MQPATVRQAAARHPVPLPVLFRVPRAPLDRPGPPVLLVQENPDLPGPQEHKGLRAPPDLQRPVPLVPLGRLALPVLRGIRGLMAQPAPPAHRASPVRMVQPGPQVRLVQPGLLDLWEPLAPLA